MVKAKRGLKSKLRCWNVVDYLIVLFFALYMAVALVPILNVLSLSFTRNEYAITHKGMLFPNFKYFTVAPYGAVFRSEAIYTSLLISIVVTVTATVIHVATALLAGFALSVKKLPFRRCLMMIVLFTMMFNGGLIPLYLTISSYNMVDTFAVLVLPGAVSAYSIILMRNFISNIPSSLLEAAELDGANPFQVLVKSSCRCRCPSSPPFRCSVPSASGTIGPRAPFTSRATVGFGPSKTFCRTSS